MRAVVLALAFLVALGVGSSAARAAIPAISEPTEDQPCVAVGDLIAASQMLGIVIVISGERSGDLLGVLWSDAGQGSPPPFEAAVVLFFLGAPVVGIAPVQDGVSCRNLIVPLPMWKRAIDSLKGTAT